MVCKVCERQSKIGKHQTEPQQTKKLQENLRGSCCLVITVTDNTPDTTMLDTRHACKLSHCSQVQLFAAPWTVAHQAPLSMGFSRQEC